MDQPVTPDDQEELFELYSELHLACARAAAALRLNAHHNEPDEELLQRFQQEEERAARIWARIVQIRAPDP